MSRVIVPDPGTAAIGACNTVLFGTGRPEGHNTDCSGFVAAFRATFGNEALGLAALLAEAEAGMKVTVVPTIDDAAHGVNGLVNCTPLGMAGLPGSSIPQHLMDGAAWAFDAVYTPVETEFLGHAT